MRNFTHDHLPCRHAIVACEKIVVKWETYCVEYYRITNWRDMYAPPIFGVLNSNWVLLEDVAATKVLHPNAVRDHGGFPLDGIGFSSQCNQGPWSSKGWSISFCP